jgi:hypothetical protein
VKNGRKSSNPFKDAVIRKIINEGLEPKVLKVKEGLTETDAYDQEEQWIKQLGLRINDTGILTNILTNSRPPALSGNRNGMWGKTHTEEVRAIISEKNKGRFKGKTYEDIYGDRADDIKKHRSDVLKKPKTPEHAVKCRENGLKGAEKIGNQRRGKRWAEIYDKDTIQKMKQARRELT